MVGVEGLFQFVKGVFSFTIMRVIEGAWLERWSGFMMVELLVITVDRGGR